MRYFVMVTLLFFLIATGYPQSFDQLPTINTEQASKYAQSGLSCIINKTNAKKKNVVSPENYNCTNWNSSVYAQWMLVKLLKEFPVLPESDAIRQELNKHISSKNVEAEFDVVQTEGEDYFAQNSTWAWTLKLSEELYGWEDPDGKNWRKNLQPLVRLITDQYMEYLQKLEQANRTGDDSNTAFGLGFAWDYAITTMDFRLKDLLENRAIDFYLNQKDCQIDRTPAPSDYFSPCLMEASLMSKVFPKEMFAAWIDLFLPGFDEGSLFKFIKTNDDYELINPTAFKLTTSWCLFNIANKLEMNSELKKSVTDHLNMALANHGRDERTANCWLATWAVYAIYESQAKVPGFDFGY